MWKLIPALLLLGYARATGVCDIQTEMVRVHTCVAPVSEFQLSPEGEQLRALYGREEEVSEAQVRRVCKIYLGVVACMQANASSSGCVPRDVPDVLKIEEARNKLVQSGICDKPDLLEKVMTVIVCHKALHATPNSAVENCRGQSAGRFQQWINFNNPQSPYDPIALLRSGRVLKDVCCALKEIHTCSRPHVVEKCTIQAVEIGDKIEAAVSNALGCEEKIAAGCAA